MATHSSIFAWRMDRGAWQATVHGVAKSWTRLSNGARYHVGNVSDARDTAVTPLGLGS